MVSATGASSAAADGAPPDQYKFADGRIPVPANVLAISPVPVPAPAPTRFQDRGILLPLNVTALIISHIQDPSDLARVTRTSRLLYYMTLPQLYEKVTLRSYPQIRYKGERPEGFGSGSPLCMALSGLSTGNAAALLKQFCITGAWTEHGADAYAHGRVPDSSMLLSIVLRNALDKMTNIQTFNWELDTKPLRPIYQGLASQTTLVSLSIEFPSSRTPRPITIIPPMPSLRRLKISNLDPLCYNDDVSVLLLHAKKLEDLRMHWSPRMRKEAEPSTNLQTYFGRCINAGKQLAVKHFAMQNFFGPNDGLLSTLFGETVTSAHFLDVFGGSRGGASNVFLDNTWNEVPMDTLWLNWKIHRANALSLQHTAILNSFKGLEQFYIVSANRMPHTASSPLHNGNRSPKSISGTPTSRTPTRPSQAEGESLGKEYLNALVTNHGATLKHLLLSDQWTIDPPQLAELVRCCPNLEQLGLAIGGDNHEIFGFLIPFLPKLKAIRILTNDWLNTSLEENGDFKDWETVCSGIGRDLYKNGINSMTWVGIGDRIVKVGGLEQYETQDGKLEWRRKVTQATLQDVAHVDMWAMDVLEI